MGIPYAKHDKDDPGCRVCPACGEKIRESHDEFGERTTNRYAEHYRKHHQGNNEDGGDR